MTVDIPDLRGAFFESWERNGNDPSKAQEVFNAAIDKMRSDAALKQHKLDIEALIKATPAINSELDYTGKSDPVMSAYIEGFHDAWKALKEMVPCEYPEKTTDKD